MQKTGNYDLNKPEYNNVADIVPAVCENMDLIDQNMKRIDDSVKDIKLDAANVTFTSSITEFASKNVKLALDYLFQLANNGKKYWVDVVGSPLAIADTFATLKDKTQSIKNIIAANITNKGVAVNNTDTLNNLADAISRITIEGMGGKRYMSGSFVLPPYPATVNITAPFTIRVLFVNDSAVYYRGFWPSAPTITMGLGNAIPIVSENLFTLKSNSINTETYYYEIFE